MVLEIAVALRTWATDAPGRGEVSMPLDVAIDERNVYAPDVLWYSEGRVPRCTRTGRTRCPTSRSRSAHHRHGATTSAPRRPATSARGSAELWLVDTRADVVLAFRRSAPAAGTFDVALELGRGESLTSPLLPGFALALDGLFGTDELPT